MLNFRLPYFQLSGNAYGVNACVFLALVLHARGRLQHCRQTALPTSSSVVAQELTLIRIAVWSCQTVDPHQQVPSAWMRSMVLSVFSGDPNETSTWLMTTSLRTLYPAARSPSAKRRACAEVRSTIAPSPARPSERRPAHSSTPRARRDISGL